MPSQENVEHFLREVTAWSASQPGVIALALVGSHARGSACLDSDIDLVLLVDDPAAYLQGAAWATSFGQVQTEQAEDYGQLTSLRVWYASGLEVEFGFTTRAWAALPLDPGTRRVISDGLRVLYERERVLSMLA